MSRTQPRRAARESEAAYRQRNGSVRAARECDDGVSEPTRRAHRGLICWSVQSLLDNRRDASHDHDNPRDWIIPVVRASLSWAPSSELSRMVRPLHFDQLHSVGYHPRDWPALAKPLHLWVDLHDLKLEQSIRRGFGRLVRRNVRVLLVASPTSQGRVLAGISPDPPLGISNRNPHAVLETSTRDTDEFGHHGDSLVSDSRMLSTGNILVQLLRRDRRILLPRESQEPTVAPVFHSNARASLGPPPVRGSFVKLRRHSDLGSSIRNLHGSRFLYRAVWLP